MIPVIFEDTEIIIINKPFGLVVNRSQTNKEGTLQDQLSEYFGLGSKLGIGGRAGIVHRLDSETSGLLIVAKTDKAFEFLQGEFKNRKVEKRYIALAHGLIKEDSGSIESKIRRVGSFGKFGIASAREEGREAKTDFSVSKRLILLEKVFEQNAQELPKNRQNYLNKQAKEYSLVDLFPKTGRTHQIRVHLKSIGHPVVSDLIYTPRKLLNFDLLWCPRLFLHAAFLEFSHPKTGKKVSYEADLPSELKNAMLNLTETG